MKAIFLFIALFSITNIYGQNHNNIVIGRYDSLYSNVLKEKRKIWVSLPDGDENDAYTRQKYPVIFVLDGDLQFTLASLLKQLGGGSGNLGFPKMIMVAISNTDRTRDLTPTHSNGAPLQDSLSALTSGGGENFTAFLEKELIPYIYSKYPAAPYKILFGHSLGGLFAVNTLVHHTHLFNAYIASEPSLWWDNQKLLKETEVSLAQNHFDNVSLFLGIAHTQPLLMDTAAARNDNTNNTIHLRDILELKDHVLANTQNNLVFGYKYYPDYDHQSVSIAVNYDALRFTFKFYGLNFPYGDFFQPGYTNNDILKDHYQNLSKRMGYMVLPPGYFTSVAAHQLIDSKQWDRALKLLTMNRENYADSYAVYQDLGYFYNKKGDNEQAIKFYQESLKLKDTDAVRTKLKKLQP